MLVLFDQAHPFRFDNFSAATERVAAAVAAPQCGAFTDIDMPDAS